MERKFLSISSISMLGELEGNVPAAVRSAWDLYYQSKEPEHRRFDIATGGWDGCGCNAANAR